jgi:hypothetical protein
MSRRDEFDEENFLDNILNKKGGKGMPPLFRLLAGVAGLAVVGAIGAVIWVTSSSPSANLPEGSDVPVIRADSESYKIKPDDPGGMAVPNKDSTIFETIKGDRRMEDVKVENLLEDAEEPVKKDEVFTADERNVPELPPDDGSERKGEEEPESETTLVSKGAGEGQDGDVADGAKPDAAIIPETDKPEPKADSDVKSDTKPETKTAPELAPAALGNFYVQLASVKSEAEAKTQWSKFQSQFPELSGLSLRVQKADLGAKGVFYRVQGGGVSEEAARKICAAINARKAGGCLVAK